MKTTHRRTRSDSSAAAVVAAQAAALGPIEPPEYVFLRDWDRPFWDAVVQSRARDSWTPHDLIVAANLARCLADVERLQAEMESEPDTIEGCTKVHPKHRLIETLSRRSVALAAALHVNALATQGRARDAGNSLRLEQQAKQEHDPLIPTLRVQ